MYVRLVQFYIYGIGKPSGLWETWRMKKPSLRRD